MYICCRREGGVCSLVMEWREQGSGDGHGGTGGGGRGGMNGREGGREGVVYGNEVVNGRILHSISLWNNSALHGRG